MINNICNTLYFSIGHCLMTRDAELLVVDALSNRQAKVVPIGIAGLLMWRNGIMNHGLHPLLCQIGLQGIALLTKHGEDVPDILK